MKLVEQLSDEVGEILRDLQPRRFLRTSQTNFYQVWHRYRDLTLGHRSRLDNLCCTFCPWVFYEGWDCLMLIQAWAYGQVVEYLMPLKYCNLNDTFGISNLHSLFGIFGFAWQSPHGGSCAEMLKNSFLMGYGRMCHFLHALLQEGYPGTIKHTFSGNTVAIFPLKTKSL